MDCGKLKALRAIVIPNISTSWILAFLRADSQALLMLRLLLFVHIVMFLYLSRFPVKSRVVAHVRNSYYGLSLPYNQPQLICPQSVIYGKL